MILTIKTIQQKSSAQKQSRLRFGPWDSPVIFFSNYSSKLGNGTEFHKRKYLSSKVLSGKKEMKRLDNGNVSPV